MPAVSITAMVTVAKTKPTNFRLLRSAIIIPSVLPYDAYGRQKVQIALAKNPLRALLDYEALTDNSLTMLRRPALVRAGRVGLPQPALRRGTKAVARNENTTSPRWLVPVLRACRMPHSGRFSDVRLVSTWLEK